MNLENFEKEIIQAIRSLPPEKKKEAFDFIELLKRRVAKDSPSRLKGLWKDLDVDILDKDILDCKREMWSSFPRDPNK